MKSRLTQLALGLVSFVALASGPARADLAPQPEPEKKDGCAVALDPTSALAVVGAIAVVARRRR